MVMVLVMVLVMVSGYGTVIDLSLGIVKAVCCVIVVVVSLVLPSEKAFVSFLVFSLFVFWFSVI